MADAPESPAKAKPRPPQERHWLRAALLAPAALAIWALILLAFAAMLGAPARGSHPDPALELNMSGVAGPAGARLVGARLAGSSGKIAARRKAARARVRRAHLKHSELKQALRGPPRETRAERRLANLPGEDKAPRTARSLAHPGPLLRLHEATGPAPLPGNTAQPLSNKLGDARTPLSHGAADPAGERRDFSAGAMREADSGSPAVLGALAGRGGVAQGGAARELRAIYSPLPVIPDDLRDRALETFVVARFMVGADGRAAVSLVKRTADPQLDAMVLKALRQWRFAPATRNGRPIAAAAEMKIEIRVR